MNLRCARRSRGDAAAGRERRWSCPRLEALEDRLAPALFGPPGPGWASPPSPPGQFSFTRQVHDFQVSAPAVVNAGDTFTLRIRPADLFGHPRPVGLGAIRVTTDDPRATVPGLVILGPNSEVIEVAVVLRTPGQRTLTIMTVEGKPLARSIRIEVRPLPPVGNRDDAGQFPPVFGGGAGTGGAIPPAGLNEGSGAAGGTLLFFGGPRGVGPSGGPVGGQTATESQGAGPGASGPTAATRPTPQGPPNGGAALLSALLVDAKSPGVGRRGGPSAGSGAGLAAVTGAAKTGGLHAYRPLTAAWEGSAAEAEDEALAELFRSLPASAGPVIGIATTTTSAAQAHADARSRTAEATHPSPGGADGRPGEGAMGGWEALDAAFLPPQEGTAPEESASSLELGLLAVAVLAVEARRERRTAR